MHPIKHFDQAVLVMLINGVDALKRECDIEIFVVHKAHLRRAILALVEIRAIDQVQSDALMQDVATAWHQTPPPSQSNAEKAVNGEQRVAVLHAQAYMLLITNAATQLLCEKVLGHAQYYFQALMGCGLITPLFYNSLNHKALNLVDDWSLPQG